MRNLLFVFLLLFSTSAAAADADVSRDAYVQLRAATDAAQVHAEMRYAFTVDYFARENNKEKSYKLRFDPRLAEGERWQVVGSDRASLDKDTRKMLKGLEEEERGDEELIYDGLADLIDDAKLVEESDEYAVFSAPITDDDTPEKVREALDVFIRLEKTTGHVSRIDIRSNKEFKPAPIAKIKKMMQSQIYAAPDGDGPALMVRSESEAIGRAMLQNFNAITRMEFSDFEQIDPSSLPITSKET